MVKQDKGPLTAHQLGDIASATLRNAVDLLRDAEGLAAFGRHPRAYSLAVLAAEEFGKHMMCFGMLGRDQVHADAWRTFWKLFVTHRPKYQNAATFAAMHLPHDDAVEFSHQFDKHVAADQQRRMAGLYVDWKDGTLQVPDEVISPELVNDLLAVFTSVIYHWADIWSDSDLRAMFEAAEADAVIMQGALATRDPETILKAWKATTGSDPDQAVE